jgi:hypothetical protein
LIEKPEHRPVGTRFVRDLDILEGVRRAVVDRAEILAYVARKHEVEIGCRSVGDKVDVDIDPGAAVRLQDRCCIDILPALPGVHPDHHSPVDLMVEGGTLGSRGGDLQVVSDETAPELRVRRGDCGDPKLVERVAAVFRMREVEVKAQMAGVSSRRS